MMANCIASCSCYVGLVVMDSKALSEACTEYEDVLLVVLILRIYILPVICIFKMGLDVCDVLGDYIDVAALVCFTCLQLHYGLIPAISTPSCHQFLLAYPIPVSFATIILAIMIDLSRISYYVAKVLCFRRKHVRMEGEDKCDKVALLPVSTPTDLDDLLAELDCESPTDNHSDSSD